MPRSPYSFARCSSIFRTIFSVSCNASISSPNSTFASSGSCTFCGGHRVSFVRGEPEGRARACRLAHLFDHLQFLRIALERILERRRVLCCAVVVARERPRFHLLAEHRALCSLPPRRSASTPRARGRSPLSLSCRSRAATFASAPGCAHTKKVVWRFPAPRRPPPPPPGARGERYRAEARVPPP